MSQTDDLRRLLALRAQKEQHEAALKEIGAEIDAITSRVLDRWSEDGVSSMKVDGTLVSLRRQAFATVINGDYAAAATALKAAGLEHLLRANTQTLSAYLREREEEGLPPPPEFDGVIRMHEKFSLSVRNGRH